MSDEHFLRITRYYSHSLAERLQTAETALLRGRAPGPAGPEDDAPNWRPLTSTLNLALSFCALAAISDLKRAAFIVLPFAAMLNVQYFFLGKTRQPSLILAAVCGVCTSIVLEVVLQKFDAIEPTRATVVCVGLTLLYRALDWVSREGRYLMGFEVAD